MNFIIHSLPRSRTYWLSRFLTYGDWNCYHEHSLYLRSMDDVESLLSIPHCGTCETALAPFWRLIPDTLKTVTIRRHPDEVIASLVNLGFDRDGVAKLIRMSNAKLDQIERRISGVLSIRYDDLQQEETCKELFEHCLGIPHDHAWYEIMRDVNLQINVAYMVRYAAAHAKQMQKLAAIAKYKTIQQMQPREIDHDDGLTIQQEELKAIVPVLERQGALAAHAYAVGDAPTNYASHANWEFLIDLEQQGNLQVTTAKCNGRCAGYLVAVIGPSLEQEDVLVANHSFFFADAAFPGTGMKLQRASLQGLKERGVSLVHFHADGNTRLNGVFKRLGAEDIGLVYRLSL